jgi:hypothetical protein
MWLPGTDGEQTPFCPVDVVVGFSIYRSLTLTYQVTIRVRYACSQCRFTLGSEPP